MAGNAAPQIPESSSLCFVRKVGVGEQRTAHHDEIGSLLAQDFFSQRGVVDSSNRHDRHVDDFLECGGSCDIVPGSYPRARNHL